MRLWMVIILAVVFGCTGGMAMTWLELGRVVENFQSESQTRVSTTISKALTSSDLRSPRAVIEGGAKFDFGRMAYGESAERTFVIRNEGDKELELKFEYPSCGKCIETKFTTATIAPGQKYDVPITYSARKDGPGFEESATLSTNDPRIPKLMLTITGVITKPIRMVPTDLTFGTVSSTDGIRGVVTLLAYHSDEVSLKEHKFNNLEKADLFDLKASPLPKEKVFQKDRHATSGLEIEITAKGLPIGPISENVVLVVQAEEEHTVELPVTGEVVGDITIVGKNYAADTGILALGLFKRGQGGTITAYLLVKGPHRNDVQLSVGEVTPANALKVTLGERSPVGDGKAFKIPVVIEVLKDAPAQTHMGDARGDLGKINIETTHPTFKQVPIKVRFVIE